jgi:hypothetical protein
MSAQIFQNFTSRIKVLRIRRVTWIKFNTENPQMFGATVQNLVTTVISLPEFVQP